MRRSATPCPRGPLWLSMLLLLLLPLIALLLTGCQAAPRADFEITDQRRPALWRVTDPVGGNSGYLFGTIHMLPEGVNWQTPTLVRALAASDRLVKEIAPGSTAPAIDSALSGATDEPVPPLSERLSAQDHAALRSAAEALSLDPARLDRLESWAVALLLARSQDGFLGIETRLGVDAVLQAKFAERGHPVVGLDTAGEQLARFDALDEAVQDRLLRLSVRDAGDSAAIERDYQTMVNAWLSGDMAGLADNRDGPFAIAEVRTALLARPNAKWAREVGRMLRDGGKPFVAVGAAHLAGKQGLPALLAEQGLSVERIQ